MGWTQTLNDTWRHRLYDLNSVCLSSLAILGFVLTIMILIYIFLTMIPVLMSLNSMVQSYRAESSQINSIINKYAEIVADSIELYQAINLETSIANVQTLINSLSSQSTLFQALNLTTESVLVQQSIQNLSQTLSKLYLT